MSDAGNSPERRNQGGTLHWPIGKQAAVTAALVVMLFTALHFAARNDAVVASDEQTTESPVPTPAAPPAKVTTLPKVDGWIGKRVRATTPELAEAAANAGAEAYLLLGQNGNELVFKPVSSPDGTARSFEVVIVAGGHSRPPRHLARSVAEHGQMFLLSDDAGWAEFREEAGMLIKK